MNNRFSASFLVRLSLRSDRPVCGLTLDNISVDATEFGKISGVEGLRFNNVLVTANELTQDINDSYER